MLYTNLISTDSQQEVRYVRVYMFVFRSLAWRQTDVKFKLQTTAFYILGKRLTRYI